jgi:hypothetical protein
MTKGELMKLIYTQAELVNIDTATPMHTWKDHDPADHVMNYNNSTLGTLENLYEIAAQRKINLTP